MRVCYRKQVLDKQAVHSHKRQADLQSQNDAEATTEKWGLEAGLFKIFTNKKEDGTRSKGQQAKDLITRYGSAYFITSISFAVVSFTLCYALISSGDPYLISSLFAASLNAFPYAISCLVTKR